MNNIGLIIAMVSALILIIAHITLALKFASVSRERNLIKRMLEFGNVMRFGDLFARLKPAERPKVAITSWFLALLGVVIGVVVFVTT